MKRKTIQLGKATLVMSLPAKWIKEQGISSGDELEVEESNSKLIITTERHKIEPFKTTLEFYGERTKKLKSSLDERMIEAKYIKGYDEITVLCDTSKFYDMINIRVKNLIGMEIVSQTENMLLIKDLGISTEQPIDQIIRRCFLLIRMMIEDVLKTKGNTDENSMRDRDLTINRFSYLILRKLNKELRHPSGSVNIEVIPSMYSEVLLLELLADDVERLGKNLAGYKIKDERLMKLVEDLKNMIEMLSEVYFKFDREKAKRIFDYKFEIRDSVNKTIEETKNMKIVNALYWIREVAETAPVLLESILTRVS